MGEGVGESEELGPAQLEVSICLSAFWAPRWHFRPLLFGEELGVILAFEGRWPAPGRDCPLCTVGRGRLKDCVLFAPGLVGNRAWGRCSLFWLRVWLMRGLLLFGEQHSAGPCPLHL